MEAPDPRTIEDRTNRRGQFERIPPPTSAPVCVDDERYLDTCPIWAASGECTGVAEEFVKAHCPCSCGTERKAHAGAQRLPLQRGTAGSSTCCCIEALLHRSRDSIHLRFRHGVHMHMYVDVWMCVVHEQCAGSAPSASKISSSGAGHAAALSGV